MGNKIKTYEAKKWSETKWKIDAKKGSKRSKKIEVKGSEKIIFAKSSEKGSKTVSVSLCVALKPKK